MHRVLIMTLCTIMAFCGSHAQPGPGDGFAQRQLDDAIGQYKFMSAQIPSNKLPKTFYSDSLRFSETWWWTSGFYPGTLLYLYEYSGDTTLLTLAKQKLKVLEKEKDNKTTHDLGFMLYCSYGNALRITGDTGYISVLLHGARSLAARFSPVTHTIRSWDNYHFPVIIDNMMNLEFLFYAAKASGDRSFYNMAVSHANATMKNHYRKDNSSFHVVDYDPATGKVLSRMTAQGAFDASAWARGQAWGLYGYVMMYRETKQRKYLSFAQKIAKYMLGHRNMPEDLVPYWDFNAPDIDTGRFASCKTYRDASAAAVTASALLELSTYTKGRQSDMYFSKAEKMLQSLASPAYKAKPGENGGFILMHSVGSIPHNGEIDVPLTYADYYYVEALVRYRKLLHRQAVP